MAKEGGQRVPVSEAMRGRLTASPTVRILGPDRRVATTAVVVPHGEGVTVFARNARTGAVTGFSERSTVEGYQRLLSGGFSYDELSQ